MMRFLIYTANSDRTLHTPYEHFVGMVLADHLDGKDPSDEALPARLLSTVASLNVSEGIWDRVAAAWAVASGRIGNCPGWGAGVALAEACVADVTRNTVAHNKYIEPFRVGRGKVDDVLVSALLATTLASLGQIENPPPTKIFQHGPGYNAKSNALTSVGYSDDAKIFPTLKDVAAMGAESILFADPNRFPRGEVRDYRSVAAVLGKRLAENAEIVKRSFTEAAGRIDDWKVALGVGVLLTISPGIGDLLGLTDSISWLGNIYVDAALRPDSLNDVMTVARQVVIKAVGSSLAEAIPYRDALKHESRSPSAIVRTLDDVPGLKFVDSTQVVGAANIRHVRKDDRVIHVDVTTPDPKSGTRLEAVTAGAFNRELGRQVHTITKAVLDSESIAGFSALRLFYEQTPAQGGFDPLRHIGDRTEALVTVRAPREMRAALAVSLVQPTIHAAYGESLDLGNDESGNPIQIGSVSSVLFRLSNTRALSEAERRSLATDEGAVQTTNFETVLGLVATTTVATGPIIEAGRGMLPDAGTPYIRTISNPGFEALPMAKTDVVIAGDFKVDTAEAASMEITFGYETSLGALLLSRTARAMLGNTLIVVPPTEAAALSRFDGEVGRFLDLMAASVTAVVDIKDQKYQRARYGRVFTILDDGAEVRPSVADFFQGAGVDTRVATRDAFLASQADALLASPIIDVATRRLLQLIAAEDTDIKMTVGKKLITTTTGTKAHAKKTTSDIDRPLALLHVGNRETTTQVLNWISLRTAVAKGVYKALGAPNLALAVSAIAESEVARTTIVEWTLRSRLMGRRQ